MQGMRENVGEYTKILLRRMFFASGSILRLRLHETECAPREPGRTRVQYVAVRRTPATAGRFPACDSDRGNAASGGAETCSKLGDRQTLSEERRGLLPFSLIQRPGCGHRARGRAAVWT